MKGITTHQSLEKTKHKQYRYYCLHIYILIYYTFIRTHYWHPIVPILYTLGVIYFTRIRKSHFRLSSSMRSLRQLHLQPLHCKKPENRKTRNPNIRFHWISLINSVKLKCNFTKICSSPVSSINDFGFTKDLLK